MCGNEDDDSQSEAEWLEKQRSKVIQYLQNQGVQHGGVALEPAWFIAPCVSLWIIWSGKRKDAIGWWAISGDLPTDYLSGHDAGNPRTALGAFARIWAEVSDCMVRGEEHPIVKIGNPENRRHLGDLLGRRAKIYQEWCNDDGLWED